MDWDEPTILNSNLLPVNAKGDVLFLSVVSFGRIGKVKTPISIVLQFPLFLVTPVSICSKTLVSSSPK